MLADIAIVDPDLTMTVPKEVTAATGVDALAHCVEAYTSRKAHPSIDLTRSRARGWLDVICGAR
jgi:alcohol dehydrogenase class IV